MFALSFFNLASHSAIKVSFGSHTILCLFCAACGNKKSALNHAECTVCIPWLDPWSQWGRNSVSCEVWTWQEIARQNVAHSPYRRGNNGSSCMARDIECAKNPRKKIITCDLTSLVLSQTLIFHFTIFHLLMNTRGHKPLCGEWWPFKVQVEKKGPARVSYKLYSSTSSAWMPCPL